MEEMYPFNEHNKTIFYNTTFMVYTIIIAIFCPVAIFSTKRSILT